MEKLRDMMGPMSFMILAIAIGSALTCLFDINPFIPLLAGLVITCCIFYVIDELAEHKILKQIQAQQNSFNKEFEHFRDRYVHKLETMQYLYPLIDKAQSHTIQLCKEYPEKYKNEKDFQKTTAGIIIGMLDVYVNNTYDRGINKEHIKTFIEHIKRVEGLQ